MVSHLLIKFMVVKHEKHKGFRMVNSSLITQLEAMAIAITSSWVIKVELTIRNLKLTLYIERFAAVLSKHSKGSV